MKSTSQSSSYTFFEARKNLKPVPMGGATKNLGHGGISHHEGTWVFMGGTSKPLRNYARLKREN